MTDTTVQPFVVPLEWREPAQALLALGSGPETLALIGGGDHPMAHWSFIMDKPVARHIWTEGHCDNSPFESLQASLDALNILPDERIGPFQGGWAGVACFELGRAFEKLPWPGGGNRPCGSDGKCLQEWPDLWLGLFDTIGVFNTKTKKAWVLSWGIDTTLTINSRYAKAKAHDMAARLSRDVIEPALGQGTGLVAARDQSLVEAAIARTLDYIDAGDLYQANISARFSGQLPSGDSPLALFNRLIDRHPSPFAAYLNLGDLAVVSHSPERFLSRTAGGQLETRPIKGTAPRDPNHEQDLANARNLEMSAKDRAENVMIVDLMRNDLSRVCLAGTVKVPRLCALESFTTVHHLVSDIVGQQKPGLGFFDALAASFPPGSITGAPKVRAMEIISELEGEPRGPWCGSIFYVGFDGRADSNVLIRTASCKKAKGRWQINVRAGAGIVADSKPELEYAEISVKAAALRIAAKAGGVHT